MVADHGSVSGPPECHFDSAITANVISFWVEKRLPYVKILSTLKAGVRVTRSRVVPVTMRLPYVDWIPYCCFGDSGVLFIKISEDLQTLR